MCRLHFGKVIPSQLISLINLLLDVQRCTELPREWRISDRAGARRSEMLGRIHWPIRYGGRGIQFVAGFGYVGTVRCYVIDFNFMLHSVLPLVTFPLQRMLLCHASGGGIQVFVDSSFSNGLYPTTTNKFRTAYLYEPGGVSAPHK